MSARRQPALWTDGQEEPAYLTDQLVTYIGNKRSLLAPIRQAVERIKLKLVKPKLKTFDAFAGSGVVSRLLKAHSEVLVSNDLEDYAAVIGRCFLRNRSTVNAKAIREIVDELNAKVESGSRPRGFIEELYAPRNESKIKADDRVFYTRENARRLDGYRQLIEDVPNELRDLILGPLLSKASIHANTAGVFKGFYKDRATGIGRFGGSNADALQRIRGVIRLEPPILSRFECDVEVLRCDANDATKRVRNLDLTYIDPPYNQHPYGSNYFMLNLLTRYEKPASISPVSGIPKDWQRSGYNVRSQSLPLLRELLLNLDSKYLLISFNDEGFITPEKMLSLLNELGTVEVYETKYNTFRGCRNLGNRDLHVMEQLFLVERK